MEFSEEIAVLQGAFFLTQKQAQPKTLGDIERKHDCGPYVKIIGEAVNDVVTGLSGDHDATEQELARFKIHAAIFVRWLQRTQTTAKSNGDVNTGMGVNELPGFDGVIMSLPPFSTPVYVTLLKNLCMGKECIECIMKLPHHSQELCMEDLLDCIATDIEDTDVQLWIDMLQSAMTTFLQESSEDAWMSGSQVLSLLMKSFDTMKNKICDLKVKRRIAKLLVDFTYSIVVVDSVTAKGHEDKGQGSGEDLTGTEIIQYCRRMKSLLHESFNLEGSAQIGNLTKTLENEVLRGGGLGAEKLFDWRGRNELIAIAVPLLWEILLNVWPDLLSASPEKREADVRQCESLDSFLGTLVRLHRTMEILLAGDVLKQQDSASQGSVCLSELRPKVETLCEKLKSVTQLLGSNSLAPDKPMEDDTELTLDTTMCNNDFEIKLEDAFLRVKERLDRYQECMEWLLTDCKQLWFSDRRWIDCLTQNLPAMPSTQFALHLIQILHDISGQACEMNEGDLVFQLKEVLLECFTSLPIESQNRIRDHLVSSHGLPTLFEQSLSDTYHQHLTTVFNQLVHVDRRSDFREVLAEVSCLAFQSPYQILSKAVAIATTSSAQVQIIVQILQCMASCCKYERSSGETLLCYCLARTGMTSLESTTERNNFLELISLLLKPYRSPLDQTNPFSHPPLLDVQEVVKLCILPYLSLDSRQTDDSLSTGIALKLLKVAMGTAEVLDSSHWMIDLNPFPIMLCLCRLLEVCNVLWDSSNGCCGNRLEIKELTVELLQEVAEVLKVGLRRGLLDEVGIVWLKNRLQSMDWVVALHLNSFLSDVCSEHIQYVPASLLNICDLPSREWQSVQLTELSTSGTDAASCGFLAFLQGCRVSIQMSAILMKSLKKDILPPPAEVYKEILIALVQVLPQCTRAEWDAIVAVLQHLVQDGILRVPYSTRFMKHLPFHEFQESLQPLSISQLLTSVLEILSDESCVGWTSLSLWRHITKLYAGTIKDLAEDNLSTSQPKVFTITQLLCNSCRALSITPVGVAENVFVLTLELLNIMEEFKPANGVAVWQEMANQRRALTSAINVVPDDEQRARLFQKLDSISNIPVHVKQQIVP